MGRAGKLRSEQCDDATEWHSEHGIHERYRRARRNRDHRRGEATNGIVSFAKRVAVGRHENNGRENGKVCQGKEVEGQQKQ